MNKILKKDIDSFSLSDDIIEKLKNKRVLITGATGLIGSTLIHCLLALKQEIKVIAPVRNIKKAHDMFCNDDVQFIECDLLTIDYDSIDELDYIVHCAAPTSSRFFVDNPVETAEIIYGASQRLLRYASTHQVKGFIYVSSLEVYGSMEGQSPITEDMQGYLNPLDVRSSYPMAKRMVENLCCLYAKEYGVRAMIARLTQTMGAGVALEDNRVLIQFSRLAAEGKDIVLHTTGKNARPYCYTTDAISAILHILLKGEAGEAYNVANEDTYLSARELAEAAKRYINPKITVKLELRDDMGYAAVTKLPLSTKKLQALGWQPKYNMESILKRLAEYVRNA